MAIIDQDLTINQIVFKRGVAANINVDATKNQAVDGEPHWTTDTDTLYMFDGTQNIPVVSRWPITRVTTTYTILITDYQVFANTDGGAYTVTLPAGTENHALKIANTGSSTNNLTVAPNGAEHLLGANSNFTLSDGETLIITYNSSDGWY